MARVVVLKKAIVVAPLDFEHRAKLVRIEWIKGRLAYLESVRKERWAKLWEEIE